MQLYLLGRHGRVCVCTSEQAIFFCVEKAELKLCENCLICSWNNFVSDPEVHPQNEDYWGHVNPIGPRACYDEGKRVAETMCYAYMKQVSSSFNIYCAITLSILDNYYKINPTIV